mgnify:CR=1 FL=1
MDKELTIANALIAIQDLGYSPDSAEVHVIKNGKTYIGTWYDAKVLKVSEIVPRYLTISASEDEVIITATFGETCDNYIIREYFNPDPEDRDE